MTANEIHFISGFQWVEFKIGTVPNHQILAEMLRPGIDPTSINLVQVELENYHKISDFISQLLLQKYSNWLVSQLCGNNLRRSQSFPKKVR
jgi:hypothetical protein